ncbi:MAG: DUF3971 domain-containing protein [Acetobacter sp.]|nr:DUF3971 domain-containing protein [Acetobacter sp.]
MSTKSKKLRFISLFWDYASALSLIALLVLLWHLGKGPVQINFLRPYIIQALTNETSSYDLSVGSVNLELVHSVQPVEIIAKDVQFTDKKGNYLVRAPRLSLSFSARALLKGLLAPSAIEVVEPEMHIRAAYGVKKSDEVDAKTGFKELNLKKLEFYFEQFEDFMERFNSPEKLYLESFINNIKVTDATLVMDEVEMGQQFTFKDLDFVFERGITDIEIKTDSAVMFENRTSGVDMTLNYRLLNDEVRYTLNFSDLVITDLYDVIVPEKGDVRAVDVPVNGQFSALIDFGNVLKDKEHFADNIGKNIKDVSFAIEGGKGKIGFGDSEDFDYNVSSFNLGGRLHGGLDKVNIEKAIFDFDGKKAELSLSAEGFKDYFLKGNQENFKVNFTARLGEVQMDELSLLWPKYLGEKAWAWCKESLYGGAISNGIFSFDFGWDKKAKSFGLLKLQGKADVADANLHYLEGMPVIRNVYGTASFEQDKIGIKVDKGVSDGVILTGGNVLLYDLDKEDNFIAIDMTGNSTITDALKLIDHEPLGFTKEMGVDPEHVAGDVDINLKLDFELKSNLKPEEIKVEVLGDLKQVEYLGLEEGKSFVADMLKLKVTEKGFELSGVAKYQDIPLTLALKENFSEKAHKSRIIADVQINDAVLKTLGVDSEILAAPYFTGQSDIRAALTFLNNGEIELVVDGSLKDTAMDYAFLGFVKEKGVPCRAKATMIIADNKIKEVTDFSLLKAQFSAKGKVLMDKDGQIKTIDIVEIKSPKAFAKAKVNFSYQPKLSLKVTVSGDAYDLTEFFDSRKKTAVSETKAKKKKSLKDPLEDIMDTDIVVGVNKLWTNNNVPVTNFAGKAELRNGIGLHRLNLVGNYGSSREVKMKLDFEPRGSDYLLTVDSNNAGSTLKVLRLYDNMRGGNLKIEAKRDKYRNIKGHAKMWDFALSDTPVVAKVLSLASLTGMVDMLTGEGLTFSHLTAPFTYTFSTKNLATEGARMFGSVLGMSVSGRYNLVDEDVEAKGLIIPAYGLNKFIGNIPLVGKVLAGKDGTVFATNYDISGSIDKPVVSINPLSTLAPNSIKELFSSEE